ncbi:MAG: CPBP family intramembrane metalloprotease [Cytophagaceae bacterium]|jgi:hypothetical protein|nr:CPBP family intramembrane metalloprotease [Cytophagaceae bacterium]
MLKQLKMLFGDFAQFFRKDFHLAAYTWTVAVTALSILIVYGTTFGKSIAANTVPTSSKIINNILIFALIYFLVAIPVTIIRGEWRTLSKPAFLLKGLLLMCLIGFADAFSWRDTINLQNLSALEQSYIHKVLWRMRNIIFVLPTLAVLRLTIDRDVKGLYGIGSGNHHVKAYLSLYVVILPILAVVSLTPDFQSYYPSYKPWIYENVFGQPVWLNTIIYEIIYISDFFMVETIFRGVLVIGMASILGRTAVLPMIAVYVALHFGKPVMETASALFGGYFLGVLAFQTRHIWGGVIIHMGIAFIIEILRFVQHYFEISGFKL